MFVRPCWRPRSAEDSYRLIEANPWALLVSNGPGGPLVTNLPLMLDRARGSSGTLIGHIARANHHTRVLQENPSATALAVFHGASSYVTPTWYPNRDMPGTYYYTAVHCYGRLSLLAEPELEASLHTLNDRMEDGGPGAWRMDEIPHSEVTRRLPAILGFELEIERIEGKFKLGQDEPRKDAMAVAEHLASSGEARHRELAEAVRRANQHRPEKDD